MILSQISICEYVSQIRKKPEEDVIEKMNTFKIIRLSHLLLIYDHTELLPPFGGVQERIGDLKDMNI